MGALYRRLDASTYRATELTQGPWDPQAQHGGAPAALIASAIEATPGHGGNVARLSIEILGPIPIGDFTLTSNVIRPGRRIELVGATLAVDDRPVATAAAWRYAVAEIDLPDPPGAVERPPPPTGVPPEKKSTGRFADDAMEIRHVSHPNGPAGSASAWFRLRVPVVENEPTTPLQRTMAAADFSNGIGRYLDFTTHLFINTDLTVNLYRTPLGEWIGLTASSQLGRDGRGHAGGPLFDVDGPIGRSNQTLLVGVH